MLNSLAMLLWYSNVCQTTGSPNGSHSKTLLRSNKLKSKVSKAKPPPLPLPTRYLLLLTKAIFVVATNWQVGPPFLPLYENPPKDKGQEEEGCDTNVGSDTKK